MSKGGDLTELRRTEAFLITYATLIFSSVVILSLLSVERLDAYVSLFAIEFFVASELTSPFGRAESRRKFIMGILLLAVFTGIIIQRVMETFR